MLRTSLNPTAEIAIASRYYTRLFQSCVPVQCRDEDGVRKFGGQSHGCSRSI